MSLRSQVLALSALVLLGSGCQTRAADDAAQSAADGPGIRFTQVSLAEFDGATKIWQMQAGRVRYEAEVAYLQGVTFRHFRPGKPPETATAREARFDTVSRDVTLLGPVIVTNASGEAKFDDVVWKAADRKLLAGPLDAKVQVARIP